MLTPWSRLVGRGRPAAWLPLIGCLLLLSAGRVHARLAEPDERPESEARRTLDEVARAYQGLSAYADQGEIVSTVTVGKAQREQTLKVPLKFAKPNRFVLEADDSRLVSDGQTLTTAVPMLKTYVRTPAPKALTRDSLIDNPLGALVLSGPSSLPMGLLLTLLGDTEAARTIGAEAKSLALERPDVPDGARPGLVLKIERREGPGLRLTIDPATKLLQRIELVIEPGELKDAEGALGVSGTALAWSAGSIKTAPLPASTFAFQEPAGLTRVVELAERWTPKEAEKSPLEKLVGQPAPDFFLNVLDGPNETRKVRKADLAGKVVLLDFWATWCPPCMQELPEIQKLIERFARKKTQGLAVVALSLDSEGDDLEAIRALVEKTLKAKNIELAIAPVGSLALDPAKSVGKAFHIEGIPTIVLIDAKGTVQAVHVGYSPEVSETLADEIGTLLQGGSLLKEKAQPDGDKKPK